MPHETVLITGAAGNLGAKLRRHLSGHMPLRLLDIDPRGDAEIARADMSQWDTSWVESFRGAAVVAHFAADPTAQQTWPRVLGPNVDAVLHLYEAAARMG